MQAESGFDTGSESDGANSASDPDDQEENIHSFSDNLRNDTWMQSIGKKVIPFLLI
jgi:hypothetical protein